MPGLRTVACSQADGDPIAMHLIEERTIDASTQQRRGLALHANARLWSRRLEHSEVNHAEQRPIVDHSTKG